MAFEQFRTQVLLLHSQQSMLDRLSAGISDRYSVHCATSGSEALLTLGETPIHVIVSAQELPGMSGLQALREARKRSPETMGILLAGPGEDDDLEAMVGDEQMFKVIRGEVTPEAIIDIIESPGKTQRLLALSESANDTRANVDEPTGEHIVMETDDNGSTIISDGTARLRALKSRKPDVVVGTGNRDVGILVMSKDDEFVGTIKNSARGLHDVHHAVTPAQADDIARKHKIGVLITDAALVGSDVGSVAQHLRKERPRLVAIVAGRRDDGELLMDLINRGHVYRFLLKPVSPGRVRLAIEASLKHHLEAPDDAFGPKSSAAPAIPPKTAKPEPRRKEAVPPKAVSQSKAQVRASKDRENPFSVAGTMTAAAASERLRETSASAAAPLASDATRSASWLARTAGALFGNPKILGMAGTLLLLVLGAAWFALSGDSPGEVTANPVAPGEATAEPVVEQVPDAEPPPLSWAGELELARAARDTGNLMSPPGVNAVELYIEALAASGGEPAVADELGAVTEQILSMAEVAILARNVEQARAAMDMARLADPENARLGFLGAQLDELEISNLAEETRNAIREGRFEDAGILISEVRSLAGSDQSAADALTEELAAAHFRQRIEAKLALANERLTSGKLTAPADDSAQFHFESVIADDPENQAARQGLVAIAGMLVLQARNAVDNGEFERAEGLLGEARELDVESGEVAAATAALADAREAAAEAARRAEEARVAELRRQEEARLAEIQRREEAARQAELAGQQAEDLDTGQDMAEGSEEARNRAEEQADEKATSSPLGVGAAPPPKPAQRTIPSSSDSAGAAAAPRAEPGPVESEPPPVPVRNTGDAQGRPPVAAEAQVQEQSSNAVNVREEIAPEPAEPAATETGLPEMIPVSRLTRTYYVSPEYPRAARRRRVTGAVDITFTITADGDVRDASVLRSEPGDTFDQAAIDAVEQWRFEPIEENGVAVAKRSAVRLAFDLQ